MILAAGVASRFGALKQLEPVGPGGATLLEYSAFDAWSAGFGRVVLVVRPQTEARFRAGAGARIGRRMPVSYVLQKPPAERRKPWGTAHAVLVAENAVSGPFAVINADDFYGREPFATMSAFLATAASRDRVFAMHGFDLAATLTDSGPMSRALCRVDGGGWLEDIVERHGLVRGEAAEAGVIASMNLWGFTPAIFADLRRLFAAFLESSAAVAGEFLLPDAVRALIRQGRARVKVLTGAGEWCGVTFRGDRPQVVRRLAELVERGSYPRDLWGEGAAPASSG